MRLVFKTIFASLIIFAIQPVLAKDIPVIFKHIQPSNGKPSQNAAFLYIHAAKIHGAHYATSGSYANHRLLLGEASVAQLKSKILAPDTSGEYKVYFFCTNPQPYRIRYYKIANNAQVIKHMTLTANNSEALIQASCIRDDNGSLSPSDIGIITR
jgi:hypothetical protein